MDLSTSIPSSSNISQFSRIRKGTAELSPAQPKSLTPAEMRSKVVEILADTANGCLQELGYYPGMPAKLQASEARNKAWQTENVKLYEDNVRLAANGKAHQEAIRLLSAPEAERIRHIRNLEVENRALKTQVEHMKAKANADLAGKDQAYANLHKEFSHLTESYNLAYQEILRLRDIISGQSPIQPHFQNKAAHQAYQQQSPPISQQTRQVASTGVPQALSQIGPMPIPTQNVVQGRSYNAPNAQHQLHRIGPEMVQNEELQRQNLFNSSTRVVSGTNSMNSPQMQPPYPPPHIQQFHGQPPSISPVTNVPPQYRAPSTQYHAGPTQLRNMGTTLNVRRASIANPPSDSQMSQAVRPTLPPPSNNPTVRVGSAPLPNQNPGIRLPPPLNAFNESIRNASHSTQVMPNSDSLRNHISQQTTISPNDTLINPHPTLLAPTPIPANVSTTMLASTSPTTYTSNTGQSFQRTEPITATAASMPPIVRSDTDASHNNASSPILPSRTMGLKRESMSMDIDVPNASNKKPRVQSPGTDLNTPPPPSPSVPPPSALSELSMSEAPFAAPDGQAVEEEEEDEVVEVGPDGLRLVEDILEQVYGENRRGEVVCWFCQHRYDKKYTENPPTPFINATDQELEQHCMTEHLDAWNQARADV